MDKYRSNKELLKKFKKSGYTLRDIELEISEIHGVNISWKKPWLLIWYSDGTIWHQEIKSIKNKYNLLALRKKLPRDLVHVLSQFIDI